MAAVVAIYSDRPVRSTVGVVVSVLGETCRGGALFEKGVNGVEVPQVDTRPASSAGCGIFVLSDRDRRVLLLLEQELLLDDPVWMARLSPLLAGGPPPHRSHWTAAWRALAWVAVLCGLLLIVLSTGSSSPWGLAVGTYLAGGAVIALVTASG